MLVVRLGSLAPRLLDFAKGTHLSAGEKTLTRLQAVGCDIQHVYAAELLRDAEEGVGVFGPVDLSAVGSVLF